MKSMLISSNASGGGKTTVTIGLMKAFLNRGYTVQGYKVGPDYIDTAFHTHVIGKPSRNLDLHLMGAEGLKASFSRGDADLGIIEGVMGLYDGIGIDSVGSSAYVAKTLDVPVLLVLSPKAQVATLCAELNGLIAFDNIRIVGVILSNVNESYYCLLKACIEHNCAGVKVFGYLPADEGLSLSSRHLGLIQSQEIEDLDQKVQLCASLLAEHVDLDAVLQQFSETAVYHDPFHLQSKGIRSAVAMDNAFSFYYQENLELLSELGEVVYFSPLNDKHVPENIDFLYLGGGYPEVYATQLSENKGMLSSINDALLSGLRCYAECGGMMYLTEAIEGHPMVGFFSGTTQLTQKLQHFGYCTVTSAHSMGTKETDLIQAGTTIPAHEFHTSTVALSDTPSYHVSKTIYDGTVLSWTDGYCKKNTLAAYPHVHFFGNLDFLDQITG